MKNYCVSAASSKFKFQKAPQFPAIIKTALAELTKVNVLMTRHKLALGIMMGYPIKPLGELHIAGKYKLQHEMISITNYSFSQRCKESFLVP